MRPIIFILGTSLLILLVGIEGSSAADYDVFEDLQVPGTDETFDIPYTIKRNLSDVSVETLRNSITFTFAGKTYDDTFTVILPTKLIEGPFTVWLDDTQITNFIVESNNTESVFSIPLFDITEQTTIVGSNIAGEYVSETMLINQISAKLDKPNYALGDTISISGKVIEQRSLPHVTLNVFDPKGNMIILKTLQIQSDSTFFGTIPITGDLWSSGKHTLEISGVDATTFNVEFNVGDIVKVLPPLKQIKNNIAPENVVCNEGLELMKKISNGNAICVKPPSVDKLIEIGFAEKF